MNIICPNCGAGSRLENGKTTCECPYCGTGLSANNNKLGQSVSRTKNISYIELAETAYLGKDFKSLKKYADLALEQNVQDGKLWLYKTLAEAKNVINERNRTSWIFECGEKAILYAKNKKKAAADVYLVYLELAIDKLQFISQWSPTDLGEEVDSTILEYEKDVITLFRKIPKDAIDKNPVVKEKLIELSQQWLRHCNIHIGTLSRIKYLKQIYYEIAPITDEEKEREIKLLVTKMQKTQSDAHQSENTENNTWQGCLILIVICLLLCWLVESLIK